MATPRARDRVLDLAVRGRKITGMVGLRPGFYGPAHRTGWRPDEEVQQVLDEFVRSAGPLDAELRAIAADGYDVGRVAAAIEFEGGGPARLRRRDPRLTPWPSPDVPREATVGVGDDAWDDATPPPPPLPDDAPVLVVAMRVRQLQVALEQLLNGLLTEVLRELGIYGSADVRFTRPLAPQAPGETRRGPKGGKRGPGFLRDGTDWEANARELQQLMEREGLSRRAAAARQHITNYEAEQLLKELRRLDESRRAGPAP